MPATIHDIAQRAQGTISTVSRVVNGAHLVNPQTRQRVEAASNEFSYRPNVHAQV